MRAILTPHKPGDGGILCMPLVSNLPDADQTHPDWQLTTCPVCGTACWESETARRVKEMEPEIRATCTECTLRGGMR